MRICRSIQLQPWGCQELPDMTSGKPKLFLDECDTTLMPPTNQTVVHWWCQCSRAV